MSTCKIDRQGRVILPSSWRNEQGIEPGAELVVLEEEGRLIIQTRTQAVREAQEIVRRTIRPGVSLLKELQRDRRRQLAKEEAGAGGRRRRNA